MSNKKRIEELKAEIARLEKEDEFHPYLAWVSDENEMPDNKDMPTIIDSYDVKASYPYRALRGYTGWKYATPLTRKEILSYLPPTTKYDWDAILKEYPEAQVVARNPDGNIVIGTYTSLKVSPFFDCFYCDKSTGKVLFAGRKPEWILKDCDWRDSIEYRRDVV